MGVTFLDSLGARRVALLKAGGEVILAAGALGSPQLLLLSGLGPMRKLQVRELGPRRKLQVLELGPRRKLQVRGGEHGLDEAKGGLPAG